MTFVGFLVMVLSVTGVSVYLFLTAVTNDTKCILKSIDQNSNSRRGRKQIYKQFSEFIELDSTIKQLSLISNLSK